MDITLYEKQIKKAVNSCGRMLPNEQKDDFFQECYLVLLEKQKAVEEVETQGEDEARKYVYTIARNKCIDLLRANKKDIHSKEGLYHTRGNTELEYLGYGASHEEKQTVQQADDMGTELGRIAHFGVSNADLDLAISRLPLEDQYVINELFFEGNSTRHVARQVGKSQFWPRNVKARAIANLQKQLIKKGNSCPLS